jgi:hypothetical protein
VDEAEEDPAVSSFEELGPKQPGGSRSTRRSELLLGLLLLLAVIGVGGWTWWQGEGLHAAYRAGDQAATAHHWDDARAAFLAAGDYPNAKTRAAAAGAQIVERDKQYTLALTALAKHDGVAALQALDALDQIEPGYGATVQLRIEANTQVYRSALDGMVALRREASPPGLYYRSADDWVWLEGSDVASSLRNYGDNDYVVYDVPVAGSAPKVRQLMAARFGSESPAFTPIALNAGARIFWGAAGGWSYQYGCSGSVPPELRADYCADGMIYSAAGSAITTTVSLPGPDWIVADLARDGSKMLVADLSAATSAPPRIRLYLAAPDGGERRLLYDGPRWLERAAFSQDGRYVLALVGAPGPAEGPSYEAVLLDVTGGAAPQILSSAHYSNRETPAGMDFALLGGAGAGRVAVAQYSAGQPVLKLIDLNSPRTDPQLLAVSGQMLAPLTLTRLDDGGLLLCGRMAGVSVTLDPLNTNIGQCQQFAGDGQKTTFTLPLITRYGIGYAWPRQGSLIYPIVMSQGGSAGMSILRIGAAPASGDSPAPEVILQLPLGAGEWLNVVAGADLLAYARQGQLHVRTYDGTFDLVLEQGIDTLYDVRGEARISTLF